MENAEFAGILGTTHHHGIMKMGANMVPEQSLENICR